MHPKKGLKKGPRFSDPFLMLLNCHPGFPIAACAALQFSVLFAFNFKLSRN